MRDNRSNDKGRRASRGRDNDKRGGRTRGGSRGSSRGRGGSRGRDTGRRSPLSGVGDAETNSGGQRGPYLVPGRMVYEFVKTDWITKRNGGDMLIHTFRVASVYACDPDPSAASDPKYADPATPYKPGDKCVYTIDLSNVDNWQRNLKTLIVGIDPEIADDEIDDFVNLCYPPEILSLDDTIDQLLDGDLVLRDAKDREIEIADESDAEDAAIDHLRALKAWESPIVGTYIYAETWRNSGKSWVNARWVPCTDEQLDELGVDKLKDTRGGAGRARREERNDKPARAPSERRRRRDRDRADDEASVDALLEEIEELADDDTPSGRKLDRMDREELAKELERLKVAADDVPF